MESAGHTHHHYTLNQRVTRMIGADMRLLYGIAVPMFATIGFIIALAATGQSWMVGPVVVFLLITVSVVVFGLLGMLDEDDDDATG
jgi:cell shape-determining protein MreD